MALVAPFKGLTYNFDALADISGLMAPPYDVISEGEQEDYYRSSPYNVIRLVLGKKKMGDSDWDNRYTRAADCLSRWQSQDILIRCNRPAMFLTSLTYDPGDGSAVKVRWGLIALIRIEEEDTGVILPHERTFSAHKDDRLKLMRACNAQLSQIFGLYEDPEKGLFSLFKSVIDTSPRVAFDFKDGSQHRMWIVQDRTLFKRIADIMRDKAIFIADGHHRYETSRNYRNIMRARFGRRPLNRSYEFVMMYLTSMDDTGLTILPSHRLIKRCPGFQLQDFFERIKPWFHVTPLPRSETALPSQCLRLKQTLEDSGRSAVSFGFHLHGHETAYLLTFTPGTAEERLRDLHPSLKKLDVILLSRLVLQGGLGFTKADLDDDQAFHYESNLQKAVSQVQKGVYQMAFLLNPTKMGQVKEVAGNNLIMPRKSTFFYPKVLTGLVFNRIDPHEIIETP